MAYLFCSQLEFMLFKLKQASIVVNPTPIRNLLQILKQTEFSVCVYFADASLMLIILLFEVYLHSQKLKIAQRFFFRFTHLIDSDSRESQTIA